jgi:hypothetical protein
MSQVKILYRNILENSTIVPSSEDAVFPRYRLVDRDIGKLFKGTSTPNPFFIAFSQAKIFEMFESWATPTDLNGWIEIIGGGSSVNRESVVKEEGFYSCRLDVPAAAWILKYCPLAPSTPHKIFIKYQNSTAGDYCKLIIRSSTNENWYLQNDGTWGSTYNELTLPNSLGAFSLWTFEFTTHPDIENYSIFVGGSGGGSGSKFYFDFVVLAEYWPANRVIIPKGHNLSGLTLTLLDEDSSPILSWVAEPGLIDKTFAEKAGWHWQLNIASPVVAPQIPEIFIGKSYTFLANPVIGAREGWRRNEQNDQSRSGYDQDVQFGPARRFRTDDLHDILASQKTELESLEALCGGFKPFFVEDHNGTVIWMKLLNELDFGYDNEDESAAYYSCQLQLREVLGG